MRQPDGRGGRTRKTIPRATRREVDRAARSTTSGTVAGCTRVRSPAGAARGELARIHPEDLRVNRTNTPALYRSGWLDPARPGHDCRSTRRWTWPRRTSSKLLKAASDAGRAVVSQNLPTGRERGPRRRRRRRRTARRLRRRRPSEERRERPKRREGQEEGRRGQEGEEVMLRAFFGFIVILLGRRRDYRVARCRPPAHAKPASTRRSASRCRSSSPFRDENDKPITLGDCIGGKPTILVPVYYRCPMNCNLVRAEPGEHAPRDAADTTSPSATEFNVICFSMDPKEQAHRDAAAKKKTHARRVRRPGAEKGWRFLTGTKEPLPRSCTAIGFRSEFDKVFKEYNHPSGDHPAFAGGEGDAVLLRHRLRRRDRSWPARRSSSRRHVDRADDDAAAVARSRPRAGRAGRCSTSSSCSATATTT